MHDELEIHERLERLGVQLVEHVPRQAVHVLVQPRIRFTFDAAPDAIQEVIVERWVDTLGWVSGVLIVRLQAKGAWEAGTTMSVIVRRASYADDEPSTLFTSGTTALTEIHHTQSAPKLVLAAFTAPIPAAVSIAVRLLQPSRTGMAIADLGIELVGRTASRLRRGVLVPNVARPRRGIVQPGTPPVLYREPWAATTAGSLARAENVARESPTRSGECACPNETAAQPQAEEWRPNHPDGSPHGPLSAEQ